jgi:hypothetical protein
MNGRPKCGKQWNINQPKKQTNKKNPKNSYHMLQQDDTKLSETNQSQKRQILHDPTYIRHLK